MKILMLSPFDPFREDNGSKMRIMNILHSLEDHDVRLVAFRDEGVDAGGADPSDFCREFSLFDRPKIPPRRVLRNHFSLRPLLAERFFLKEAAEKIRAIFDEGRVDVVIAETLLMSRYLARAGPAFRIIDEHNLEFVRAERRLKTLRHPLKRLYHYGIWRRLKRYELKVLAGCRMCWVCSGEDETVLRSLGVGTRLRVVPNAVDIDFFKPAGKRKDPRKIVFLGTMWYEPNADAVEFFASEILPGVLNKCPEAKVLVVGDRPEKTGNAKSRDGRIEFTGYVADIRPHIEDAAVFVAPLRMGSGTRLKILTALAMGLPVVSTSIGAEGLAVTAGNNIRIADSAEEFRNQVIALLENPGLGETIGRKGRKLAEEKYSHKAVRAELKEFWKALSGEIGRTP